VIKRKGKIRRGLILLGSVGPTLASLARGLWRREGGQRWLLPLALFLCATGLVLLFAFSVEALAPFIYAIF
jgi:Family of unknown function (DUF5989)